MKIINKLFTDASGSINGLTFEKSSGGLSMRLKTQPKKGRTQAQNKIRTSFAQSITVWRRISVESRAQWGAWGKTLKKYDRLGNRLEISGLSAFTGAYIVSKEMGISQVRLADIAVKKAGYVRQSDVRIYIDKGKINIVGLTPIKHHCLVSISEIVNQDIVSTNRKYVSSISRLTDTMLHPIEINLPPTGKRVFLRIVLMDVGLRYSESFYYTADGE